jgi:O-antigen/teichoic acid export membrane protein
MSHDDGLEPLSTEEVLSRATSGAALLGVRGLAIYAFGIVANLYIASVLQPRDFGLFALGLVLLVLGSYVSEGGFGAALIRREGNPSQHELEAVLGLQLAATTLLALAVAAACVPLGRDGLVVATMAASLPFAVLRTPSVIVAERRLRYRVIATGDVVEAVVYYLWAIGAVALGFGVWGLATGIALRAVAGSLTITLLGHVGFLRPRWSWSTVRPFIGFGVRFQGTAALYIAREQGLNLVVGAVAGLGTLGIWSLGWRVLQVPNLMFVTVGRVAFTAVSRLVAAGRDVRPAIERGIGVLAVVTGLMIAALVGLAVALPAVVGHEWSDVPAVILWSGIGLIVASPIGVATPGYLFAADAVGTVAAALALSALVWFGVAAALLPSLGAPAVGIGWIGAGIVNSLVLARRTKALTGAALLVGMAPVAAVSIAATAAAWLVARQPHDRLLGGVLGAVAGEAIALAGMALFSRPALRDARDVVLRALAGFRRGAAPAAPPPAGAAP